MCLSQIFCALKYIHSANVWHRDLKPGNLLVNVRVQTFYCRNTKKAPTTHIYADTPWFVACRLGPPPYPALLRLETVRLWTSSIRGDGRGRGRREADDRVCGYPLVPCTRANLNQVIQLVDRHLGSRLHPCRNAVSLSVALVRFAPGLSSVLTRRRTLVVPNPGTWCQRFPVTASYIHG